MSRQMKVHSTFHKRCRIKKTESSKREEHNRFATKKENTNFDESKSEIALILKDLSEIFMSSIKGANKDSKFVQDPYASSSKKAEREKDFTFLSPKKNIKNLKTRENSFEENGSIESQSPSRESANRKKILGEIHLTFSKGPKTKRSKPLPKTRDRSDTFETNKSAGSIFMEQPDKNIVKEKDRKTNVKLMNTFLANSNAPSVSSIDSEENIFENCKKSIVVVNKKYTDCYNYFNKIKLEEFSFDIFDEVKSFDVKMNKIQNEFYFEMMINKKEFYIFTESISQDEKNDYEEVNEEMKPVAFIDSFEKEVNETLELFEVEKHQIEENKLDKEIKDYVKEINNGKKKINKYKKVYFKKEKKNSFFNMPYCPSLNSFTNIRFPKMTNQLSEINSLDYFRNQSKIKKNLALSRCLPSIRYPKAIALSKNRQKPFDKNIDKFSNSMNFYQLKLKSLENSYVFEILENGEWSSCISKRRLQVFKMIQKAD